MSNDNPAPGTGANFPTEAETPQTNTQKENDTNDNNEQIANTTADLPDQVTLSKEQFNKLLDLLAAGNITDKSPAPSLAPGNGLQTNPFGQVVGTVTKFNINKDYYPDPTEKLYDEKRFSRFNLRENYFIVWSITTKPYPTKDNLMVQEPTFHLTLYMNIFDDEGEETGKAIVIQTLHMNEDEEIARLFAAENDIEVTEKGLKELMDATRYSRSLKWLENIFFPPRTFELNIDSTEEAIGGSVVKVVTKSNVKGFGNPIPKIEDEELS